VREFYSPARDSRNAGMPFGVITCISYYLHQQWRLTMVRMMVVLLVALAAALFDRESAAAAEAPWCAVLDMGKGAYWDCQYRSIEDCRPVVLSGSRGWCNPNPYFVAAPVEHRLSRKVRVRAQ
jgi:hypothetical protein